MPRDRRSPFARASFNTSSTIGTHALVQTILCGKISAGFAGDPKRGSMLRRSMAQADRPMKLGSGYPAIETLAAVIAHSQIVVAQPHSPMPALPAGFEDLDIAVPDWIAVEGRRPDRGSCGYGPGGYRVALATVAQAMHSEARPSPCLPPSACA
jgi:hypothetical protein